MTERVVEILIYIMMEIRKNHDVSRKLDLLSRNLIKKGYTESEISSAFTWLLDKIDHDAEEMLPPQNASLKHSFRHLHEIERTIIEPEAYGYIIQLRELGIIDEFDVEQILERILMLGPSRVDVSDVKSLISSLLSNSEDVFNGVFLVNDGNQIIH
jgi:uncharacterized protein Smg (DUF494 family)